MTTFSEKIENIFKRFLPSPFTIAIILTIMAFFVAYLFGSEHKFDSERSALLQLTEFWYNGIWNPKGLVFAVQMMLMLLLGHVIALSKPVDKLLDLLVGIVKNEKWAAFYVALFTILMSLFNWGLGLVFGALYARKIGQIARAKKWHLNFGLIGAAAYSGLMVWHGGLSGSAPLKASDKGEIAALISNDSLKALAPESVPPGETLFAIPNLVCAALLILIIPLVLHWVSSKVSPSQIPEFNDDEVASKPLQLEGAEKLDHSKVFGLVLGLFIVAIALSRIIGLDEFWKFKFLNPNYLNFFLLGLAFVFHGSLRNFLGAVDKAISGTSGILIQFPLYFGILGLIKDSGVVENIANSISNGVTENGFAVSTFFSAGLINVFVPSGGGQWAVQGPMIAEVALQNNLPLNKCIMAMSYGDQLTNMLQPFWAIPLLSITGLKAKDILPYSLIVMMVGIVIFCSVLLVF